MIASATRTVCAVDDLQVDVIDSLDELRAVKQDWERVYDADPEAQYFLTWSWIFNWLASTRQRWLVLAVRPQNAENYIAFFPLRFLSELSAGSGFRHSLRMAGSYYAAYTGFICHPDAEARGIAALGQALQKLNWAELHLDDIFPSERRLRFLFDTFPKSDFEIAPKPRPPHLSEGQVIDHDVYVIVPLGVDWETFLSSRLGSRTRFHARNELKLIGADREFRISIADKESVEQDLEALLQMWEARWAPKNPRYAKYIVQNTKNMVGRCFDEGSIFLPVLWKGDTRVGMTLSFADRQKGRLIGFLAARDQSIKKPAPGFVLNLFAIRWAIENGFTTCDLGTGNFAYKFHLGGEETLVKRYRIGVRSGANLHGQVDSGTLDLGLEELERVYKSRELLAAERGCREILAFDPGHARVKDLPEKIARLKSATLAVLVDALKLQEGGHIDDALWLFQKALEIDATNFEAHHQIGVIYFRQRAFKLAERFLRQAVEINGNSAGAFNNLGSALSALGRLPEALDCYGRAMLLKPDYAMALKNHANTKAMIEQQQRLQQTESATPDEADMPAPNKSAS
jgi:CelD/BcsL family acetyltransferase involved in cellulose biosynthesis